MQTIPPIFSLNTNINQKKNDSWNDKLFLKVLTTTCICWTPEPVDIYNMSSHASAATFLCLLLRIPLGSSKRLIWHGLVVRLLCFGKPALCRTQILISSDVCLCSNTRPPGTDRPFKGYTVGRHRAINSPEREGDTETLRPVYTVLLCSFPSLWPGLRPIVIISHGASLWLRRSKMHNMYLQCRPSEVGVNPVLSRVSCPFFFLCTVSNQSRIAPKIGLKTSKLVDVMPVLCCNQFQRCEKHFSVRYL